ncbi:ABC transporter, ATP-binding protein [marine gamma proteobacterium HTCC2143]|uniref:ABC transporter, ATP-binding protein n=1 Tax=marine gamma proteobacterium HTCC2143 TaxID=247633 RepID=A0YFV8_9GAMM|nr:ABC transporter, ATP-binding protein [marine gamma proteobacterium HTCC2143]
MDNEFVRVSNLRRSFSEGDVSHSVLRGASLSINRGETIALLGRSGSGKSTLLNVISGIDRADEGVVFVDGINLTALSEHHRTLFRRQHIGFIYQFFNLIPTLTASENVALVLELNGYKSAQVTERTEQIICAVGLDQQKNKFPDQLSGGEQQRVAIARALVHSPKLVLADELTGNLDAESGKKILSLLQELMVKNDGALFMVTHSLAVAKTADRILTLDNGLLIEREGNFAW